MCISIWKCFGNAENQYKAICKNIFAGLVVAIQSADLPENDQDLAKTTDEAEGTDGQARVS